jgi:acyl-CoA reductase-like NAD-dependent aldehyde dehydrogenase
MERSDTLTVPRAGNGASHGIPVENPATGETIATVPVVSADEVARRAARARAAQPAWRDAGVEARGRVFRRAQHWLLQHADRFFETIIAESGKTYEDAQIEITAAAQSFRFWAKNARRHLADERVPTRGPLLLGRKVAVRYEPVGLVGVIGPWNYPLVNTFCDAVPALLAGNAVLLKPSEVTPLTSFLVAEMMQASGLPADVLQVVSGGAETGTAVVDEADFVMFTGSVATGRKVMERAARTMTPVSLELGGKDPMIVLADANLERAANGAVYYSMLNSGQVCISVERVYVEAPVYDEFVAKVVGKVRSLRQGAPGGPGSVEVGALTFPPQLETIESHVADAVAKGAKVLSGGRRPEGPGRFYEPTVLVDVDHSMACMTDETFGPVLPIMKVRDADEAIALANDSRYGLQSSIWTGDGKRGRRLARRLQAGVCCVNDAMVNYTAFAAPMGGWKTSGVGSRHGAGGIRKYCTTQTVLVNRLPLNRDLHMYPYSEGVSKLMTRAVRWLYGRGGRG